MATDSDRAYWYGYFVARGGRDGYVHSDIKSADTRKMRSPYWLETELQLFREMDEYAMGNADGTADDLNGAPNPIRGFDARPDLVTGSDVITSIDLILGKAALYLDDPYLVHDGIHWQWNGKNWDAISRNR